MRALREPLLHFLLIGALIFVAGEAWRAASDTRRIMVTDETVAALEGKHRLQFGRAPDAGEREALVQAWVDEEVLYREGRAMGLDRDDEIVRRRIAQKVQFLHEDLAIPAEPTDAELRRHFEARPARYAHAARTTFRHLYFSPDDGGAAAAKTRAAAALARLAAGAAPESVAADPFPDREHYVALSGDEVERVFGRSPMAQALDGVPQGRWSGPFGSGYGWHLVRAEARYPGAPADFAQAREQVRGDFLAEAQATANAKALADMKARYRVERRDGGGR